MGRGLGEGGITNRTLESQRALAQVALGETQGLGMPSASLGGS